VITADRPPVLILDETPSTNAEARMRAEAGDAGPLWIMARRQTAGRGRRGRAWETGAGNLAATLLSVTTKPPSEAAQISFIAALAVADLADSAMAQPLARLKWPNDVLVQGRKISGILVESGPRPDGTLWLAVGIGINLQTPPDAAERPAAAIADFAGAQVLSQDEAMARLSERMSAWMRLWDDQGFAPIAKAWTDHAYGLGSACTARLGHETVEGIAEGLDPDGSLRLRLADTSVRRISAGDVFFGEV
jgi:BirA family transcriptional regulator, biotin operon repressor / biotin---[acetyl-CoA-carboxylase] ligase